MATKETYGVMGYVDEAGNQNIHYPVTQAELVDYNDAVSKLGAGDVQGALDALKTLADAAGTDIGTALANAAAAAQAAQNARSAADAAGTAAQTAQSAADAAGTAAGEAKSAAATAQSTANTAQQTASGASTAASEAKNAAASAASTASAAQTAANGKARIATGTYQGTNTNKKTITAGFTPKFLFLFSIYYQPGAWAYNYQVIYAGQSQDNLEQQSLRTYSATNNGLEITGTGVNSYNFHNYYWVAIA